MKTKAVILAGGEGSRLGVLVAKRAKPAVPFAGKYRIIDFALSNLVNSGILDVMMLTQYRPHSLNEHIGSGRPWDLDRGFTGGLQVYQPYKGRADTDWYAGTADAVQQNFSFVKRGGPDLVLVMSGDHIYQMNYDPMLTFHLDHMADLTIATIRVTPDEATRMGVLSTDDNYRVREFVEKPKEPPSTLVSMGIYVFNLPVLDRVLLEDSRRRDSAHDFGKDIIPRMLQLGMTVYAYPYGGYWVDVGTVDSYWRAHMDLLQYPPKLDFNDRSWIMHTKSEERPPVFVQDGATVRDSLLTDGTVIARGARVERSVLSPGVYVGPEAVVVESILFTDCAVEAGARVERAIIDKLVTVGHQSHVGRLMDGGAGPGITVVGKNSQVPNATVIGRGAQVSADMTADDFPRDGVAEGQLLEKHKR
jgi:glucose-1-phosphate adenylyltransferase